MARIFLDGLKEFDLQKKIQGISVDNFGVNITSMVHIELLLKNENITSSTIDQHFKCIAHVWKLGVQDLLKLLKVSPENRIFISGEGDRPEGAEAYLPEEEGCNANFERVNDSEDVYCREGTWNISF